MKLNRSGMGVLLGAVTVGVSSLAVPASAQAEPEADRLVYSRDWSLHTVRGDGTDDRVLAAKSDGEAHYFDPDLSSDGERVAATRCTSTSYADGCVIVDIAIDGPDLRVLDLPAAPAMHQAVLWAPHGTPAPLVSHP